MNSSKDTKNKLLEISKKLVPGTVDIGHCDNLADCMEKRKRLCNDLKNLCISCKDNEKVIGGISYLFGITGPLAGKNGIVIYRYGQAGSYATMVEGNGIKDILEKVEKDEIVKDIEERTRFINEERKEAEDLKTIEAFKRHIEQADKDAVCVLVTKKNSSGEYEKLDNELIRLAKEKEEQSGKKIKIIDQSEIDRKLYIIGIDSKKVRKKLELEADIINDSDSRIHIFVIPVRKNLEKTKSTDNSIDDYVGILAINSIDDDVANTNDNKEKWKNYFNDKYKGLHFISTETFKAEKWS